MDRVTVVDLNPTSHASTVPAGTARSSSVRPTGAKRPYPVLILPAGETSGGHLCATPVLSIGDHILVDTGGRGEDHGRGSAHLGAGREREQQDAVGTAQRRDRPARR